MLRQTKGRSDREMENGLGWWAHRCSFLRWEEHGEFAEVLCCLRVDYAGHEAAPVQGDGDPNGHLIESDVALSIRTTPHQA